MTAEPEDDAAAPEGIEQLRKLLLMLLGGLLLYAFYAICRPFLGPAAWAAIVVLSAWPFHAALRRRLPRWPGVTAAITSLLMLSVVLAIVVPVARGLGPELKSASLGVVGAFTTRQEMIQGYLSRIPYLGENLATRVAELEARTADLDSLVGKYSEQLFGTATNAVQGVGWFLFQFFVFTLAVFFFLYYGEEFSAQVRLALLKMDRRTGKLLLLVQQTVTGVLYGLVFTAIAQGFLAGVGFAVAGVQAPVVLGVATAILSLVPYGPQLVYVPVSALLVVTGSPVRGVLLAVWGFLVVSSADNVLKPYFIARQTAFPLPMALVGVVGGILSFGLIGVFIGPVVVALVRNLWLAWTSDVEEAEDLMGPEPLDVATEPPSVGDHAAAVSAEPAPVKTESPEMEREDGVS